MNTYTFKNGEYEVKIKDLNESFHFFNKPSSYETQLFSAEDLNTYGAMVMDDDSYSSIMLEVTITMPQDIDSNVLSAYLNFDLTSAYDIYSWPNAGTSNYEDETYRDDCWPCSFSLTTKSIYPDIIYYPSTERIEDGKKIITIGDVSSSQTYDGTKCTLSFITFPEQLESIRNFPFVGKITVSLSVTNNTIKLKNITDNEDYFAILNSVNAPPLIIYGKNTYFTPYSDVSLDWSSSELQLDPMVGSIFFGQFQAKFIKNYSIEDIAECYFTLREINNDDSYYYYRSYIIGTAKDFFDISRTHDSSYMSYCGLNVKDGLADFKATYFSSEEEIQSFRLERAELAKHIFSSELTSEEISDSMYALFGHIQKFGPYYGEGELPFPDFGEEKNYSDYDITLTMKLVTNRSDPWLLRDTGASNQYVTVIGANGSLTTYTDRYLDYGNFNVRPVIVLNNSDTSSLLYDEKYIKFGHYGIYNAPITWQCVHEDTDSKVFITKYNIDCQPFKRNVNSTQQIVSWKDSDIRSWLNNDFINNAFTSAEQELIQTTIIDESTDLDQVKIYLLSSNEAVSAADYNLNSDDDRKGYSTVTAKNNSSSTTLKSDYYFLPPDVLAGDTDPKTNNAYTGTEAYYISWTPDTEMSVPLHLNNWGGVSIGKPNAISPNFNCYYPAFFHNTVEGIGSSQIFWINSNMTSMGAKTYYPLSHVNPPVKKWDLIMCIYRPDPNQSGSYCSEFILLGARPGYTLSMRLPVSRTNNSSGGRSIGFEFDENDELESITTSTCTVNSATHNDYCVPYMFVKLPSILGINKTEYNIAIEEEGE